MANDSRSRVDGMNPPTLRPGDSEQRYRWLSFLADYRAGHPDLSFQEAKAQAAPLFDAREAQRCNGATPEGHPPTGL